MCHCALTAVEVARLTRWQLVFEPQRQWTDLAGARRAPALVSRSGRLRRGKHQILSSEQRRCAACEHGAGDERHVSRDWGSSAVGGHRLVLRREGKLKEHSAILRGTVIQVERAAALLPTLDGGGQSWVAKFSVSGRWEDEPSAGCGRVKSIAAFASYLQYCSAPSGKKAAAAAG